MFSAIALREPMSGDLLFNHAARVIQDLISDRAAAVRNRLLQLRHCHGLSWSPLGNALS